MMSNDPYTAYYRRQQIQTGGTISQVFHGAPYQRGHGVGSFLGGMFRTIAPLVKSGAKALGEEALRSGIGFLGDIAAGTMDPKVAASARLKQLTGSLKRKADNKMDRVLHGGGSAKKRRISRKRNAKRATRKSSAKRVMRGGRVTPQSLAKLPGGRTSSKKRSATKRKTTKSKRKGRKSSANSKRDIFG